MNSRVLALLGAVVISSFVTLQLRAQIILNPNFATDTSDWVFTLDIGPVGSTQTAYSIQGAVTPPVGSPYSTAGTFTMDASDTTPPGTTPPGTTVYVLSPTDARISATSGGLGSFSQDTGATFLANTTYTLSAYAAGVSGGAGGIYDTGVGLSGGSPFTLASYLASPDQVNVGQSQSLYAPLAMVYRTVTIDTALPEFSSLVGQEIYANLVSNNDTIYGRPQYFNGVTLTAISDVPEPSSMVLVAVGCLFLAISRSGWSRKFEWT